MSETPTREPAETKAAATILLLRDQPEFQVLMVKRHHQIDFASGALVFPGGKTHAGDQDPAWADHCNGWDQFDDAQRTLRIGAIREAYEEAGILLAEGLDGSDFAEVCDPAVRSAVDRGETAFIDVVRELGVRLRLDALAVFARWITPTMMPKRFDTWFYAVRAPADQVAAADGREAVDAEWISPAEILRMEASGERTVIFPTRMNVQMLAEASSAEDCVARAQARTLVTVLPVVEVRDGARYLVLPSDAGYGAVAEPMDAVKLAMKV
ncbi:MAG: NUDIX domain-containing protein [Alphaproteobacteria bacterium]|nr:NUDIX domain-containing protein [Alphaproteobacteria bacterium]MBU1514734.1 NUDIX domain-containing protein [Alphaproteobacteria bacterium]MBU2093865.1 NUDIX domain-containing protein [Alphaproteobacteria bacterium]MBU2151560.1 NUDIX domain-containing protein [Alphaproteobacteria bacterium]MBU2309720.1 NUDIX domain-containing protein [Alphaproteobacteria bacterium]